jgi:predicted TIM-barrel fold metal-dependent hydrolase
MKLKVCLAWFASVFVLGTVGLFADDDLPKDMSFSRYERMLKHSPFAVATATAPVGTAPDFAKDLYVANAARSREGDLVTIASSSDKDFKKYLTTKGPVEGFSISTIDWSDRVGGTKVMIAKDGQFATLGFNEALLSQPIQNPQAQMQPPAQPFVPQPGMPQRPPAANFQVPPPKTVPAVPTPRPHVRGIIHRNVQSPVPRPTEDEQR